MQYFHPEDELFSRNSRHVTFPFTGGEKMEDGDLKTFGLLALLDRTEFETAIGEMETFIGSGN